MQAELQYEIDAEAVALVREAGDRICTDEATGKFVWNDIEPQMISYSMKAESLLRTIEQAKMSVFKKTQKYTPNWMLVSPDVMPILGFVNGFKPASAANHNGPYFAGEVANLKVFVSPILGDKVCYLGVLGNDGMVATGVYAPLTSYAMCA